MDVNSKQRRRHSAKFKAKVLCPQRFRCGARCDLRLLRRARRAVSHRVPRRSEQRPQRLAGTLVRDEYKAYDSVLSAAPDHMAAGCLAHARRKFDEPSRDGGRSAVVTEALQHIARIYRAEREIVSMTPDERLAGRLGGTRPLWEQLHAYLMLKRGQVPDGSATAKADYSLNPPVIFGWAQHPSVVPSSRPPLAMCAMPRSPTF